MAIYKLKAGNRPSQCTNYDQYGHGWYVGSPTIINWTIEIVFPFLCERQSYATQTISITKQHYSVIDMYTDIPAIVLHCSYTYSTVRRECAFKDREKNAPTKARLLRWQKETKKARVLPLAPTVGVKWAFFRS